MGKTISSTHKWVWDQAPADKIWICWWVVCYLEHWHEKRKCYQWFWKNRSKLLTNKKSTFEKLRFQIFITEKTSSCFSDLCLYKKIRFTETTTFLVVINIQSLSFSKVEDSNAIHLHHLQVYGSQIGNSLQLMDFWGATIRIKFDSCNDTT